MSPPSRVSPATRALQKTDSETWAEWTEDRERRELQARARAMVAAKVAADQPIDPTECTRAPAADTQPWRA